MSEDLHAIWKALADRNRRQILALLRGGPVITTKIVEELPHLSRFGVMKHISVLRDAGLILVREEGPRRLNYLNVVPIRRIYEELVDGYQDLWVHNLTGLKKELEESPPDSDESE